MRVTNISIVVYLFCITQSVFTQNNSRGSDDNERFRTALQQGLDNLYSMTNLFLDVVQPKARGSILDNYDGSNEDFVNNITRNGSKYILHFVGFLVCLAVGVLFFVLMPLVGLIFCCCRLCGRCGGAASPYKHKRHRCWETCLGICLFLLNSVILSGLVCLFLTNALMRHQTKSGNGLITQLGTNIDNIIRYRDNTLQELRTVTIVRLDAKVLDIHSQLDSLPDLTEEELKRVLNITAVVNRAQQLVNKTDAIREHLYTLNSSRVALIDLSYELDAGLNDCKNRLLHTLAQYSQCDTVMRCHDLKQTAQKLNITPEFTQLQDVERELTSVQSILDRNFSAQIVHGEQALDQIGQKVNNQTKSEVTDIKTETRGMQKGVNDEVEQLITDIKDQVSLERFRSNLTSFEDDVDHVGYYMYCVLIGLGCLLILIVTLNYLGLMFGCCGVHPTDETSGCDKNHGANLILGSVGFQFLFSWVFMLVVMILFILGGLSQTVVCRNTVNIDSSPVSQALDDYLARQYLKGQNISIITFLTQCKNNAALYRALPLADYNKVDDLLQIDHYNLRSMTDRLQSVSVSTDSIHFYTSQVDELMSELIDSGLQEINFDDFRQKLNVDLLTYSLVDFVDEIVALAEDTNLLSPALVSTLQTDADNFRALNNGLVVKMNQLNQTFLTDLALLEDIVKGGSGHQSFEDTVTQLRAELKNTETRILNDAEPTVKTFIAAFSNNLIDSVDQFLKDTDYQVTNMVGRCRPLYDALDTSILGICVDTLDPFNGIWFCLGWSLFFFIPCIIIGVKLAGYYRKYEPYHYRTDKEFDDPEPYERTLTSTSHVPLRDYDGNSGVSATDNYTNSRSNNLRSTPLPSTSGQTHRLNKEPDYYTGEGHTSPPSYYNSTAQGYFDY